MKLKSLIVVIGIVFLVELVGCDMMGDAININANAKVDVETTSDLGQDTLDRIDDINNTLNSGVEIGPETRETIDALNETIANGIKAGFDAETLARLDELLRVVEDGLKIGLDDETLDTIDGLVNTIDEMPGNWEASAQDIIQTLDNAAGSTAKTLADEVTRVIEEARVNYQQMTAITGIEFRCNVDFMGSKVGASVSEFIGKSIVGKLRKVIKGEKEQETIPSPWVCQVIPDSMVLSRVGNRLVYEDGIVTLTGYNYVTANTPSATIIDEVGNPIPGVNLYPYLSSPYQIQLNMQDLDLSMVPARSRLVFTWPNVSESSGVAILLPGHAQPVASFTSDITVGNAPLTVHFRDTSAGDPVEWDWSFGDGGGSHEQNPTHEFIDSRDFQVQLTVKNSQGQSSVINIISVGTPLSADFSYDIDSSSAPLSVHFTDKSKGAPDSWEWDFGDGVGTSSEKDPDYLYITPNTTGYQVSLTVRRGNESATMTASNRIIVYEELIAQFTSEKVSGKLPLIVEFTDQSQGGSSIATWKWDFGDLTPPSTQKKPTHTFEKAGVYDITLTITRKDGEQDTVVKNEYINVYAHQSLLFPGAFRRELVPQNAIYFTSFANIAGGTPFNTNISTQKYVCGVNGMSATNGVITYGHINQDGLRVFMYPQQGTWRILSDFQDIGHSSSFPSEVWKINVICFNRDLENGTFLYKDDFELINGGDQLSTGISPDTYSNCGVMGVAGLGATGFLANTVFPVVMEANVVDEGGNSWIINSDMDVHNGGDQWDLNVLCLKRSGVSPSDKPTFLADVVEFQTSIATSTDTGISTDDYLCGVNGYKATLGDIYAMDPLHYLDPSNLLSNMLSINAFQKNGTWWVEGNIANRIKDERWEINLLCVKKGVAVQGTPPN